MQSIRTRIPISGWNDPNRFIPARIVARLLGISPRTVRHHARRGTLPARKIGVKIWQYRAADVLAFKRQREAPDV
jgi:DNA-binding transcriptional MerR regulator